MGTRPGVLHLLIYLHSLTTKRRDTFPGSVRSLTSLLKMQQELALRRPALRILKAARRSLSRRAILKSLARSFARKPRACGMPSINRERELKHLRTTGMMPWSSLQLLLLHLQRRRNSERRRLCPRSTNVFCHASSTPRKRRATQWRASRRRERNFKLREDA